MALYLYDQVYTYVGLQSKRHRLASIDWVTTDLDSRVLWWNWLVVQTVSRLREMSGNL